VARQVREGRVARAAPVRREPHRRRFGRPVPDTYDFREGELNSLGYRLLQSKRSAEAVAIFQLNATVYPTSSNAYDSLGEACRAAGQTELSIRSYRKSLDLDPQNTNASNMLKELVASTF